MSEQLKGSKTSTPITTTSYGSSSCNEKAAAELAPLINADRPAWAKGDSAAKADPYAAGKASGSAVGQQFNPRRS